MHLSSDPEVQAAAEKFAEVVISVMKRTNTSFPHQKYEEDGEMAPHIQFLQDHDLDHLIGDEIYKRV